MKLGYWIPLLALLPCLAHADFIIFKSGQQLEGEVIKEDEKALTLKVAYGTIRIEKDKILTIRKETEAELEKRKAAEEEKKLFEDRMRRLGRVLYKGKWIPEEDKEKILAGIAKKKKEKAEAKKKAEEKKKKAEEEARKKREKLQREQEKVEQLDPRERRLRRRQEFRDKYIDRNFRPRKDAKKKDRNRNRDRNRIPGRDGASIEDEYEGSTRR